MRSFIYLIFFREFEKLQVMYNEMKKMRGLGDEMGRMEQIQRELDYARYKHLYCALLVSGTKHQKLSIIQMEIEQ